MKRFINNLKVLWNDERGKALIKLSLYLIFMTVVVLYAKSLNSNYKKIDSNDKINPEKFYERTEYLANIKIDGEDISLIGGDIISFSYNGSQYTVVDSIILKEGEACNDFLVEFWKINPKFVGDLLNDREEDYVSKFKDGSVKYGYYISLEEFINEFSGSDLDDIDNDEIKEKSILVVVEQQNSKIKNIELQLNSYYDFVTNKNEDFSIILSY